MILFFDIFPMVLTFSDLQSLPLYAFFVGDVRFRPSGYARGDAPSAGIRALSCSGRRERTGGGRGPEEPEPHTKTEEEILEDMQKLGM